MYPEEAFLAGFADKLYVACAYVGMVSPPERLRLCGACAHAVLKCDLQFTGYLFYDHQGSSETLKSPDVYDVRLVLLTRLTTTKTGFEEDLKLINDQVTESEVGCK